MSALPRAAPRAINGRIHPTIEGKAVCATRGNKRIPERTANRIIKEKKAKHLHLKRVMLTMFHTSRCLWKNSRGHQVNVITDQSAKEVMTWPKSPEKTKELIVDKKGKGKPDREGATSTRDSGVKMKMIAIREVRLMHTPRTPLDSLTHEKGRRKITPKRTIPTRSKKEARRHVRGKRRTFSKR
ncbi:hypothetical protein L1987_23802 [Smallanthus sonchifolius]|uniref:Uncharacterized protein n=1 Tax=Smallanthus sonchifolius TaxID=185202 RepID=A0ACB9IK58_9ASTR|nr:hypothetical protein L1987_23802 [Smallanthus sonchifolius]